jgi:hypothetical protein
VNGERLRRGVIGLKKIAVGVSAWLALITVAHVLMNVNWDIVLNDRLPLDKRKLNVAYIPVT